METASVQLLKEALRERSAAEMVDICLRLARFKKENKELLNYLLLGSQQPDAYLAAVQEEASAAFQSVNRQSIYLAKKSIRKILRTINRHIKYIASREAEVTLLLHFCRELRESGIPFKQSTVLLNLYHAQLKKIKKSMEGMHEDLQYDYQKRLQDLSTDV